MEKVASAFDFLIKALERGGLPAMIVGVVFIILLVVLRQKRLVKKQLFLILTVILSLLLVLAIYVTYLARPIPAQVFDIQGTVVNIQTRTANIQS